MRQQLITAGLALSAFALAAALPSVASHVTPGDAGHTKVNIYDDTHNGWNVSTNDPVTGAPDPAIGFVNFRPTIACTGDNECDPDHIILVVQLKNAAPNCTLSVQLVTTGGATHAGLAPDGNHTGAINVVGSLTTNDKGHGTTGAIVVDVVTLSGIAASGGNTYAHVDLEDVTGSCTEADGTGVANNEYGASGQVPGGTDYGLAYNIHWLQP